MSCCVRLSNPRKRRMALLSGIALAVLLAGPAAAQNAPAANPSPPAPVPPASAAPVQGAVQTLMQDDKQWPMAAKNYANTRFSGLDQINAGNVGAACGWPGRSRSARRAARRRRRSPSTARCFVVGPYAGVHPNQVFALDAASGDLKWSYAPKPNIAAQGVACCDVVNARPRLTTTARSSSPRSTTTASRSTPTPARSYGTPSSATSIWARPSPWRPLVVKGKVLVGNSGGEMGVRGWLTALDENTGNDRLARVLDRARFGGADRRRFQAALRLDEGQGSRRQQAGRRSKWKIGGGTVWGWISYDPELNLIYYGTSNPGHLESRSAARRQSLDVDALCPRPRYRHGQVGLCDGPARSLGLRRDQRERRSSISTIDNQHAQGADPSRPQRLHVRDRPRHRRGDLGRCLRHRHLDQTNRSQDPGGRSSTRASRRRSARLSRMSVRRRPARRTGSRPRGRRAPSSSTCRTSISA